MKTNSNVSYKDIFQIINDFRKENNDRFDKIEKIFLNFHKEEFIPLERRIISLEKLADRALLVVVLVTGIVATGWQLAVSWIKKQFSL